MASLELELEVWAGGRSPDLGMQFQTRSTVPNYFEVSLLWLVANNLFSFSRLLPTTLEQKSEPALRWEDLTIVGAVIKRAFELGWGENCTGGDGGRWWPSMVATSTGHQQAFIRSEPGQWQACRGPTTATERPCKGSEKPSRAWQGECPGTPYGRAYMMMINYFFAKLPALALQFWTLGVFWGVFNCLLGLWTQSMSKDCPVEVLF